MSEKLNDLTTKLFNLNPEEQVIKTVSDEVFIPVSKLNNLNKEEDNTMNIEQKYFIGYAGYHDRGYDLFGGIVNINEEITLDLLEEMNKGLMNELNEDSKNNHYTAVQVFNLVKLD